MRLALLFLVVGFSAFGQTTATRMTPDEAEKHLLKNVAPIYPPLAKETGIAGLVILEIEIDESGTPSVRRVVSGHPLLQQAAVEAVREWRYQPFEIDGKAAKVITLVMVPFGRDKPKEVPAEMLFQHNFWTAEETAETALRRGDETGAAQELSRASAILAPVSGGRLHEDERAQWMTDMGELCTAQKKYDAAEEYYKKALKLREDSDKESIGTAMAQANLARFYAEEKKYDLAGEHANKSTSIYRRHFKAVSSRNPGAQQAYAAMIARLSWMLSKIADEQNSHPEAAKQCRAVLEFQAFLDQTEQNSFAPACQKMVSESTPKN